jgi:hypothetical protein
VPPTGKTAGLRIALKTLRIADISARPPSSLRLDV